MGTTSQERPPIIFGATDGATNTPLILLLEIKHPSADASPKKEGMQTIVCVPLSGARFPSLIVRDSRRPGGIQADHFDGDLGG